MAFSQILKSNPNTCWITRSRWSLVCWCFKSSRRLVLLGFPQLHHTGAGSVSELPRSVRLCSHPFLHHNAGSSTPNTLTSPVYLQVYVRRKKRRLPGSKGGCSCLKHLSFWIQWSLSAAAVAACLDHFHSSQTGESRDRTADWRSPTSATHDLCQTRIRSGY